MHIHYRTLHIHIHLAGIDHNLGEDTVVAVEVPVHSLAAGQVFVQLARCMVVQEAGNSLDHKPLCS